MKINGLTILLGGAAAYLLIKNLNAAPSSSMGQSYGIGGAQTQDYTPKEVSVAPKYSPEQKEVLMNEAIDLFAAAKKEGNAVEQYRAQGMANLANGTPIGVSADMAKFIEATGTGAETSNPNNYVQTGGAIRYVGLPSEGHSIGGGVF